MSKIRVHLSAGSVVSLLPEKLREGKENDKRSAISRQLSAKKKVHASGYSPSSLIHPLTHGKRANAGQARKKVAVKYVA